MRYASVGGLPHPAAAKGATYTVNNRKYESDGVYWQDTADTVAVDTTSKKPFSGILYDSKTGLSLVGTGASFTLDPVYRQKSKASLKVVTGVGNNAEVELNPCGLYSKSGCMVLRFYIEDCTKIDNIFLYVSLDTSYTSFTTFGYLLSAQPPLQRNGWHEWRVSDNTLTSGGERSNTLSFKNAAIQRMKIRVNPVAGQSATLWLDSFDVNPNYDKARVIITSDDSYDSWYNLAIPYLNAKGIKSTLYNIASLIGTPGFITLKQLKEMYSQGHDIAVHGATNLSSLTNPGARYNDIKANVDFLMNNDMPRAAMHYAWPNGVYEMSTGDRSLKDALISNNIVSARGTSRLEGVNTVPLFDSPLPPITHDAIPSTGNLFNLPIIGHSGTADVGTTQLNNLLGRVTKSIDDKGAFILMFHKIGTSPGDALFCPESDFMTIIDTIANAINNGTCEALTISQWYDALVAG